MNTSQLLWFAMISKVLSCTLEIKSAHPKIPMNWFKKSNFLFYRICTRLIITCTFYWSAGMPCWILGTAPIIWGTPVSHTWLTRHTTCLPDTWYDSKMNTKLLLFWPHPYPTNQGCKSMFNFGRCILLNLSLFGNFWTLGGVCSTQSKSQNWFL